MRRRSFSFLSTWPTSATPSTSTVQLRRIAVGAEVDGDQPGVAVALVLVDGGAHLAQRPARRSISLRRRAVNLAGGSVTAGEDHQHGGDHDQLGQGEAGLGAAPETAWSGCGLGIRSHRIPATLQRAAASRRGASPGC